MTIVRRYRDINSPSRAATVGASAPTVEAFRDTAYKLVCFQHDQDDEIQLDLEDEHDSCTTNGHSPPTLHAHWMALSSAGDGNVRLTGYWTWANEGVAVPAIATWTPIAVTIPIVGADDVYEPKRTKLADLTNPAGFGSILLVRLIRPGATDAADTYTAAKDHGSADANFAILRVGIHYESDRRGGTLTQDA